MLTDQDTATRRHSPAAAPAALLLLVDRDQRVLARSHDKVAGNPPNGFLRTEAGRLIGLGPLDHEALSTLCRKCLETRGSYHLGLTADAPAGGWRVRIDVLTPETYPLPDDFLAIRILAQENPHEGRCRELARQYRLTRTQSRILGAVMQGLNAQAIADQHGMSLPTVRTHLQHLRNKFGCRKTSDLILHVLGLAEPN